MSKRELQWVFKFAQIFASFASRFLLREMQLRSVAQQS